MAVVVLIAEHIANISYRHWFDLHDRVRWIFWGISLITLVRWDLTSIIGTQPRHLHYIIVEVWSSSARLFRDQPRSLVHRPNKRVFLMELLNPIIIQASCSLSSFRPQKYILQPRGLNHRCACIPSLQYSRTIGGIGIAQALLTSPA